MKPSTPEVDDNSYDEISFTLPKGHRFNQPRVRSDYACPSHTELKPEGAELHGFRSKAAAVISQFKGVAWLLREIPSTGTGELELRIAVKSKFTAIVRERIKKNLVAFESARINEQIVTHQI